MKYKMLGLLSTFLFTGLAHAQLAPLPVGNTGIASKYQNDAGISGDANVIFTDDFESYTSTSQLTSKWSSYYQSSNTRIATEAGNFFGGAKALEMTLPQVSQEVSNAVVKNLGTTQDVLFVRMYTKFDPGYDVNVSSNHNGIRISAKYPGPGRIPNGTDFFLYLMENAIDYGEADPGYTRLYTYHPEQRSQWGDIFYPNGKVLPIDGVPGDFGPNFVSRPNFIPQRGRWYSYELMVKANTPGQRDGRAAMWIDGQLIADFPNLRMRDISTLKIDQVQLELHAQSGGSLNRQNKKYYDNVVIAKSYIGPVQTGTTPPPPAPLAAPSNLRSTAVSANSISIAWDYSGSGQTSFNVRRKTGSSGTYSSIASAAATARSYVNSGLSASTQYCYQVQAADASTVSANSNEICVTTSAGTTTPPPANVAPNVSITSPANGASFSAGMSIAINASASDSDGTISKVEFFNGATKLGEDLSAPYSYTMASAAAGSYSLTAKATDNAGATKTSSAVSITVNAVTQPPPSSSGQTLLTSQVPAQQNLNDGAAYELGMKFTATVSGKISAIRYFRGSSESGTRTGKIYSSTGALLASVAFPSATTTGWQQVALASPLSIAANTQYTVSVNTGGNYYVATTNGMATQISNGNLRSVVGSNGVYGPVGSRPTNSYQSTNYFRDIVFTPDSTAPAPAPAPVASTITVDNLAAGASSSAVSFTGKWCQSSMGPYFGNASLFSCGYSATVPDTYTLRPNVIVAGQYDVYIQYTSYTNRSKAVNVSIAHAAGTASKSIDQTINGSTFVLLGRYSFNVGTAGYVKISQLSTTNLVAVIDAIRLVPVP